MTDFNYDLGVVGACGHVGLPLSLVFANEGLKVLGIDINQESIKKVKNKVMPFYEETSQELLEKVLDKTFFISNDDKKLSECKDIIITIETPLDEHFAVDLSKISKFMTTLLPSLREGQFLILRSTIAPNTTDYVRNFIESKTKFKVGKDIFLAAVPERLTQNNAVRELKELPNIAGVYDDESFARAESLFKVLNKHVLRLNPLEAELTKLFTNSYRYATFALANEYFIISETLGANFNKIRKSMNFEYPRCGVAKQGFAKGPCLGKDSWILLNAIPHFNMSTTMISAAYRINDGLPAFIIHQLKNAVDIKGKKVAVLGLTFKKDTDDIRDSLSVKLVNLLRNEFIDHVTHDPYVDNKNIKEVLSDADIVILATNHTHYENMNFKDLVKDDATIVDLWNLLGKDKFIFNASELKNG